MTQSENYPIDLDLWRRSRTAPESEWWKWDWFTWYPIIKLIFEGGLAIHSTTEGKVDFQELGCPVCGVNRVYIYCLAVDIAIHRSKELHHLVYIADRWFGCQNCQTQVRDRGEIPHWFKSEDIVWGCEGLKKRAERKLSGSP